MYCNPSVSPILSGYIMVNPKGTGTTIVDFIARCRVLVQVGLQDTEGYGSWSPLVYQKLQKQSDLFDSALDAFLYSDRRWMYFLL